MAKTRRQIIKHRAYQAAWYQRNKEQAKRQVRAWQKANPTKRDRSVRVYFLRKYGLSLEDYDRLLLAQGGCCGICGNANGNKRLAVDHDHTTGKVRGLLCDSCNQGLGFFKDSVERLEAAIQWLTKQHERS